MKNIKFLSVLLLVGSCLLVVTLVVGVRFSRPLFASETTYYLGSFERTYNDTSTLVSEKVYIPAGGATVIKQCNNGAMKQCVSPATNYLYVDHLGSTVLTTKADGTKETTLQYYPYGNSVGAIHELPLQTDKLYTSQRLDFSSDLYFYNARYYNPVIGNFISADRAQGPNRYSYVGNNPVMRNDPSGMMASADDGGGGGGSYKKPLFPKGFFKHTFGKQGMKQNLADLKSIIGFPKNIIDSAFEYFHLGGSEIYQGIKSGDGWQAMDGAVNIMNGIATTSMLAMFAKPISKPVSNTPSVKTAPIRAEGIAIGDNIRWYYDYKSRNGKSIQVVYDSADPALVGIRQSVQEQTQSGRNPIASVLNNTAATIDTAISKGTTFNLNFQTGGSFKSGPGFTGQTRLDCFSAACFNTQTLADYGVSAKAIGYIDTADTIHAATQIGNLVYPYGAMVEDAMTWSQFTRHYNVTGVVELH